MSDTDARWAVGTMSGTSLDGVDAALVQTDGARIFGFGAHRYRAYSAAEQAALRAVLGYWPGCGLQEAEDIVHRAHCEAVAGLQADVVGFHGQTLAHDPAAGRTHQLGDGADLARQVGAPVAWDFRTSDMRNGGQGAPLAPFFHFACTQWIGAEEPLAFLNLGGVGNITWVDPMAAAPEAAGALWAFDTGPANAPINDLMQTRLGRSLDAGGAVAQAGQADLAWVDEVLEHPYFSRPFPKSLDRNDFEESFGGLDRMTVEDAAASLTALVGRSVARGLAQLPPVRRILVAGGGRHNPAIMAAIREATACDVDPVEQVGLNGDMLEAQCFGYLAVRVQRGLPLSAPGTTGCAAPTVGGRVSHP